MNIYVYIYTHIIYIIEEEICRFWGWVTRFGFAYGTRERCDYFTNSSASPRQRPSKSRDFTARSTRPPFQLWPTSSPRWPKRCGCASVG